MNTTPDLTALQAHLDAIKARTLAWVAEDPKNRWACYPVDEAEFWAKQGICTVAAFEHDMLVSQVYEQHRDVYGFKPDWSRLNALSDEELRAFSARLSEQYKADKQQRREARWHRKAQAARRKAEAQAPVIVPPARTGFSVAEHVGVSVLTGRTVTFLDPKGLLA